MNFNNWELYNDFYQEHYQQIRREIALNRLAFSQRTPGILERIATLLLRLGRALQQHCDRQIAQVRQRAALDCGTLEELGLSR